jgi:Flp pilus assembly protein TadB
VVNHGVWARAEVKLLVEDHGERRRQIGIGVRVRRTRLARLSAGGLLLGVAFAVLGGLTGVAAVLVGALACSEALVILQRHRLARALYHAIENTAGSLHLESQPRP